jgi:hypothetical protein
LQTKQTRHKVTGPRQKYKEMSTLCARSRTPQSLYIHCCCWAAQRIRRLKAAAAIYKTHPPGFHSLNSVQPTKQLDSLQLTSHTLQLACTVHLEINTSSNSRSSISSCSIHVNYTMSRFTSNTHKKKKRKRDLYNKLLLATDGKEFPHLWLLVFVVSRRIRRGFVYPLWSC